MNATSLLWRLLDRFFVGTAFGLPVAYPLTLLALCRSCCCCATSSAA